MSLTIRNLANRINKAAPDYAIGGLQELRAELHGKRKATSAIFSSRTIFPRYAFHYGGRSELQFNIGQEDDEGKRWRHGVAFDFEPSQSLPDPVATLAPKVDRFNEWINANRGKIRNFKMWHFDGTDWSELYRPSEIAPDLMKRRSFVFLGAMLRKAEVDVHRILRDFDILFQLYEFVESMTRRLPKRPKLPAAAGEGEDDSDDTPYTPTTGDQREIVERRICARRGQPGFRNKLRKWYADQCMVTGCAVLDLLEAAHIKPYRGENDNHPENGLLLRADIHTLFDLNLLGIEPEKLRIEVAPELANDNVYGKLAGNRLRCPRDHRPAHASLQLRYKQFQQRMQEQ